MGRKVMSLSHRRQPPSQLGSVHLCHCPTRPHRFHHPLNPLPQPGTSMNPPLPRRRASSPGDYISGSTGDGVRLFTPTCRVARSGTGPIPCSGAQLQMLTLLEHMKHQQTQMLSMINHLAAKIDGNERLCPSEMPVDVCFPLETLGEVDDFEAWLQRSVMLLLQKQMIAVLASRTGH